MKVYHWVRTHIPHLDEIVAIVIAQIFGQAAGIDISHAKLQIQLGNDLPRGKTAEDLDNEGTLLLGEGGGWADEHGQGKIDGKSASMLMAERLALTENITVIGLVKEVTKFDLTATAAKSTLGNVIKSCREAGRRNIQEITVWATEGVKDAVLFLNGKDSIMTMDTKAYTDVFEKVWQEAADKGEWSDELYKRLAKNFAESVENPSANVTNLSYLYYYRTAVSGKETADKWLAEAVKDLLVYHKKFLEARREFLRDVMFYETTALVDGKEVGVKIAAINSDSVLIDKAFRSSEVIRRYGKIDVLVIRKSSGNTTIFFNHRSKLYSDDLARMLRWAEIKVSRREPYGWFHLAAGDTLPFVPEWYYHKTETIGASAFYNGSWSHPAVPPTRLEPHELLEILRHAFHPEGVKKWRHVHRAFDRKPEDRRPQRENREKQPRREPGMQKLEIPSK